MALAILNELHDEITRLYIAGSALAVGDPRLKKYIPQLQKLGEKAPVFKSLEEKLTALIQGESKSSPEALMETGVLLYSLRYTQGTTETGGEKRDMEYAEKKLVTTKAPYSRLAEAISQIDEVSQKNPDKFVELFESGQYNDPRLFEKYCKAILNKKTPISTYIGETIIPAIGADMIPVMEKAIDLKGGKGDARLLRILHKLKGKDILPFAEKVLSEGSEHTLEEALRIIGDDPKYEETLLLYIKDKSAGPKQAAFSALARMGSAKGEEALMEAISKKTIGHLEEALLITKNPQVYQKVLDETITLTADYEKNESKLKILLRILALRDEEEGLKFIEDALTNNVYEKATYNLELSVLKDILLEANTTRKNEILYRASSTKDDIWHKLKAAIRLFQPEEVYEEFHKCVNRNTYWNICQAICNDNNVGNDDEDDEVVSDGQKPWDRRWAACFLKIKGGEYYAYRLIHDDDEQTWDELLSLVLTFIQKNKHYGTYPVTILKKAFLNKHPQAKRYYDEFIKAGFPKEDMVNIAAE